MRPDRLASSQDLTRCQALPLSIRESRATPARQLKSSRADEIGDFHRPIRDRQFRRLVTYGEETMSNDRNKTFVMLCVDNERKAHAARFNAGDESAVRKASGLMGMRLGEIGR